MTNATHLVITLYLAEHLAFVGAEALHLDVAFDFVDGDLLTHIENTLLRAHEDYELALSALKGALNATLTPANAMLYTVSLVWAKRIAEADEFLM